MVERVRHVKRGTEYEVVGEATLQISTGTEDPRDGRMFKRLADYDNVTVYRGVDGKLWVRPTDEFRDGRFEPVTKG